MKTFLLVPAIILTMAIRITNAQSFRLYDPVLGLLNNGDTVVIAGDTSMGQLTRPLYVENISGTSKHVLVQKTNDYMVPGTSTFFAWAFTMYDTSVSISPDYVNIPAGTVDSNSFFSWYISHNLVGVSYVTYSFYNEANPSDSAWVVLEYNISIPTGVNELKSGNVSVYPVPARERLNFNVLNGRSLIISILDIYGKLIWSECQADSGGSVDLGSLQAGIYSLQVDDGKSIVRTRFIKI